MKVGTRESELAMAQTKILFANTFRLIYRIGNATEKLMLILLCNLLKKF